MGCCTWAESLLVAKVKCGLPTLTAMMRIELRECGVTESVIFPDLDGLGREIKQVWEDRK
jgi:hypothetical protein